MDLKVESNIKYSMNFLLSLNKTPGTLKSDVISSLKLFHLIKGDGVSLKNPKKPRKGEKKKATVNGKPSTKLNYDIASVQPNNLLESNSCTVNSEVFVKNETNNIESPVNNGQTALAVIKGPATKAVLLKQITPSKRVPFSTLTKSNSLLKSILPKSNITQQIVTNKKENLSHMLPNKENLINYVLKKTQTTDGAPKFQSAVLKTIPQNLILDSTTAITKQSATAPCHTTPTTTLSNTTSSNTTQSHTSLNTPASESGNEKKPKYALETDKHRLEQRQKQIDFGYNSEGYKNYRAKVKKEDRIPKDMHHPVTPRKTQKCSKRSWDGQVRKWRRQLHLWDKGEPSLDNNGTAEEMETNDLNNQSLEESVSELVESDLYQKLSLESQFSQVVSI